MNRDPDLSSLSAGELMALVENLQQRLAEKDQEIEQLKSLLRSKSAATSARENTIDSSAEPVPGSTEDLLDQLERTYPLPKADG